MCLRDAVQVAEQQGKYLAKQLNIEARAQKAKDKPPEWVPFKYRHLGSMALVGKAEHHTSPGCTLVNSEKLLLQFPGYLLNMSLSTTHLGIQGIALLMADFSFGI